MEGLISLIKKVVIILLIIFMLLYVASPILFTVLMPFMPIVKIATFVSAIAKGATHAKLFIERHFNLGTGINANTPQNEAYSYVWMMGQFAKVVAFSQKALSSSLFKKYTPMRRTDVPMGAPIPVNGTLYAFLDKKFKPGMPFYGEIERQVNKEGKELLPNNKEIKITTDGIDEVEGTEGNNNKGRNSKEWKETVLQTNYMDGILAVSYKNTKMAGENPEEEANWRANADAFLKSLSDEWDKQDKEFQEEISKCYTIINGEKYYCRYDHGEKRVITEFYLNAHWVYSPIEGWCLKKEGTNKEGTYPALGTKEGIIFFPQYGCHIYKHNEIVSTDTFEHRFIGSALTGLRNIGAEKLEQLKKDKGLDYVLKMYYPLLDNELSKMTKEEKEEYYKAIKNTANTRDSYSLLIELKPFNHDKLSYWIKNVMHYVKFNEWATEIEGDLIEKEKKELADMPSYVDKDGFYIKLHEKNPSGLTPLSKGRIYTSPDGNMFKNYDPFRPVPKNFNIFNRNTPTPLMLAETSYPTDARMKYYYVGFYWQPVAVTDSDGNITVEWILQHTNIYLNARSKVWGPNPFSIVSSPDNEDLEHENHKAVIFPVFYKVELIGQGIQSVVKSEEQQEKTLDFLTYYDLLRNGYIENASGLFTGMPTDPSIFMGTTKDFIAYTEGGSDKAPKYVYYPKDITNATPWGNPVNGCISSPFGWRTDPVPEFHLGIDIAVPEGTKVRSTSDGTVVYAGWSNGYGFIVEVESHDSNYYYLVKYAHLKECLVQTGDTVVRGQVIGLSGSTGFSTGPHLHYEIHVSPTEDNLHSSDTAQDPMNWGISLSPCSP